MVNNKRGCGFYVGVVLFIATFPISIPLACIAEYINKKTPTVEPSNQTLDVASSTPHPSIVVIPPPSSTPTENEISSSNNKYKYKYKNKNNSQESRDPV
jgi:hypothetical protein